MVLFRIIASILVPIIAWAVHQSRVPLLKLCKNCIHYEPILFKGEYEIGEYYAKCNKYIKLNMDIKEFELFFAIDARKSGNCCGPDGKDFEQIHPM